MPRSTAPLTSTRRAFTLLELLVVMAILVIVISIVLPAVGSVRTSARRSATQSMLATLGTACASFEIDNKRRPGYFTAKDMGDNANANQGFSATENLLIDLGGGIDPNTASSSGSPCDAANYTLAKVGPTPGDQIVIDITRIGASDKKGTAGGGYFRPDPKFYTRQCLSTQQASVNDGVLALPDLVDAWGAPIITWSEDSIPATTGNFAEISSNNGRARFYWNANAGFLNATALGKAAVNQTDAVTGSLLGGSVNANLRAQTMTALLGSPAFNENNQPTAARATISFHCAGPNSVFLGKTERAAKVGGGTALTYRPGVDPIADGQSDDLIVKGQ